MANQKLPRVPESPVLDPLTSFRKVEENILQELKPIAGRLKALGKQESFPDYKVRELREKFVSGVFDWAIRQMNRNVERFLEEGKRNYIDHVEVLITNPWRESPRNRETFWEALEKADFFIPSRPTRRIVHHKKWPTLWREYNDTVRRLKRIEKKKWRNPTARKLAFKEKLPELEDGEVEKLLHLRKPSERALAYVRFKFKLSADIEALKKYLRVFRKDPQYGYFDFVLDNLTRIKDK